MSVNCRMNLSLQTLIMLNHYILLSCLLTCVISNEVYGREFLEDVDDVFPSWPSTQHVPKVMIEKRQAEAHPEKPGENEKTPLHVLSIADTQNVDERKGAIVQASEGNVENKPPPALPEKPSMNQSESVSTTSSTPKSISNPSPVPVNATQNATDTVTSTTVTPVNNSKESNSTGILPKAPSYQPDLSNPGVMKRGLIVFGAFALMAVAYFIFYRRKNKNSDLNNTHGNSDTNQFRYGVLQSDDRRDNLELSRILTVESDEDEDDDLEIFDLEQKKKSLSYVNLQTSDEYVVHEPRESGRERDNLLLDIEDANSDTLINWSNNGNKSIL